MDLTPPAYKLYLLPLKLTSFESVPYPLLDLKKINQLIPDKDTSSYATFNIIEDQEFVKSS